MAVEASDAAARRFAAAIGGLVELLLREGSDEEAQALELLRVQEAVEEREEVLDGDELALRHVAEIRAGGEVDGRRELGQQVIRKVEVEVEAGQIALLLLLDL